MTTIDIEEFATVLAEGAIVFDTRPKDEFKKDAIWGVKHLSLEQVQTDVFPDLPRDTPIYLICERGQNSELVGLYLEAAEFSHVYNVAGGMIAWRSRQQ